MLDPVAGIGEEIPEFHCNVMDADVLTRFAAVSGPFPDAAEHSLMHPNQAALARRKILPRKSVRTDGQWQRFVHEFDSVIYRRPPTQRYVRSAIARFGLGPFRHGIAWRECSYRLRTLGWDIDLYWRSKACAISCAPRQMPTVGLFVSRRSFSGSCSECRKGYAACQVIGPNGAAQNNDQVG